MDIRQLEYEMMLAREKSVIDNFSAKFPGLFSNIVKKETTTATIIPFPNKKERNRMTNDINDTVDTTAPNPRPVLDAETIVQTIQKLLLNVETNYAITPANLRGALSTMLNNLNKNS